MCTSCNYTWSVGESAPLCRPHHVGDEALKHIKGLLEFPVLITGEMSHPHRIGKRRDWNEKLDKMLIRLHGEKASRDHMSTMTGYSKPTIDRQLERLNLTGEYNPWKTSWDVELIKLWSEGSPRGALADHFDVSYGSIRKQLKRLHLEV